MNNQRLHTAIGPLLRRTTATTEEQTDGSLFNAALRLEAATRRRSPRLVRRHGPMVLGVLPSRARQRRRRRRARFEATFLVLVRRAASLARRPVLGDYLHGMARRTALKARTAAAHRRFMERQAARPGAAPPPNRGTITYRSSTTPSSRFAEMLAVAAGTVRPGGPHPARGRDATRLGGGHRRRPPGARPRPAGQAVAARRSVRQRCHAGATGRGRGASGPPAGPREYNRSNGRGARRSVCGNPEVLAKGVLQSMLWNKIKFGVIVCLAALATAGVGGLTYRVAAGGGQPTPGRRARGNAEPGELAPGRPAADAPPKKRAPGGAPNSTCMTSQPTATDTKDQRPDDPRQRRPAGPNRAR